MESKKRHFFAYIFLFFILILFSSQINIDNTSEAFVENLEVTDSGLKLAGIWNNLTFIHITDVNWTIANETDWCSGSGSWANPYLIKNLIINASNSPVGCGVFIENSVNVHFKIQNVTIFGGNDGIKLENTDNGILFDNNLLDNINSGINMTNCANNTILRNRMVNNGGKGLNLFSSCTNNKVIQNIIKNEGTDFQDTGIYLGSFCNDNDILENILADNNVYGINVEDSCQNNNIYNNSITNFTTNQQDYGIRLDNDCTQNNISFNIIKDINNYGIMIVTSGNNLVNKNQIIGINIGMYMLIAPQNSIIDNTISGGAIAILMSACDGNEIYRNFINNTGSYAIRLYINCDDNEIYENIIKDNANIGVELADPSDINNKFYKNSFISNDLHAYDNGTTTLWNNSFIGNYWDNYSGLDLNDDHIGDSPYAVSGAANNSDYLPIFDHLAPSITINLPTAGNYSNDAPTFNIFVNETYLYSMWYEISGKEYYFTKNGTINQAAWNALSNGSVKIEFYARDITWKVGSSFVEIVKDTSQPPDDSPPGDSDGGTPTPPVDFIPLIIAIIVTTTAILLLGIIIRARSGRISKVKNLNETELAEAQYFKDVTSILTILAIDINTGLCLSKIALHEGIGLDEHLFTGFISAIGSFKYEIAKQMGLGVREGRGDNIIEYNEFTITLMDGEYLRLGLVSHSSLGSLIKMRANQVLQDYEMKHANDLKEFDGEIHIFKDFKKIIENGLDLHLNQKFIINPKNLNKSNLSETFEDMLSKFRSTSDGFYLAEIIQPIIKNLGVSEEMAYFMIYDAYKKQVLTPSI